MADSTRPPEGRHDPAQPDTLRGDRPTVPAGFPSGAGGTIRGDVPTIGSGFGPGPSGTSRGTGPEVASGFGASPGLGPSLSSGSSITLNGTTYVVERLISSSTGEAEIYLLRHGDQASVLKLYYPNFKPKDEVLAPLKQLRHDDIINLIDYGYLQGRFFEVMEYAAGGTVDQHLPIRDPQQLRALIAECVSAFRFCHDHGIIHKDIKPGNLYYKTADQTDIAIGDFGISSMLDAGISRHLTSQSLTVGYAAPEMYGIGIKGEVKVYVGREVDYYALGVTLIHLWTGRSPFEGLGMHAIANLTITGAIKVPDDLPKDLQTLVRGLTTIDFTHRWGFEEVQRWLKGEDVPVHVQAAAPAYPSFHFGVREEAASPAALVVLLKANPSAGKKLLYSGKISAWVNVFDHSRASALDTIVEDDYPQDQDAGLQKAIYVLDPDQPYEGDKRQCRTAEELAAALEDGFSFYGSLLAKPHHPFYLYLEAHGAKKEADTFRSYFKTFSAKKALNATILALADKPFITIVGRQFTSPEEVLAARDQSAVVDLLKDPESRLSLWMDRTATKTVRTRLEAWRALQICDATTLAYVSDSAGGLPKLELSPTRVSFSDLRPGSTSGGSFDIRNLGEGQLSGAISVDKPWLALATTTIDPSQKTQTIAFTVDASGFPFGATDSATVEVRTNVGIQTVTVAIAIEQGAQAIARFRNVATVCSTAFGASLGWGIYAASTALGTESPSTLAGLLGVVGLAWCVSAIRKRRGQEPMQPAMVAAGCALFVGVLLRFGMPALSSAFNWSLLFSVVAFATAPLLLTALQDNTDRRMVYGGVVISAVVLSAATIFVDRQASQAVASSVTNNRLRQPTIATQQQPSSNAQVQSAGSEQPAARIVAGPVIPVEKVSADSSLTDFGAFSKSARSVARVTTELANMVDGRAVWNRGITVWNGSTGAIARNIRLGGQDAISNALAINPTGERIAADDGKGGVQIWSVATGQIVSSIETSASRVSALAFESSGSRLAIGRRDGLIEIWDTDGRSNPAKLVGHTDPIGALAFSPDGQILVSGSGGANDYTARVWNSRTLSSLKVLKNIGGIGSALAFSNDGHKFAVAMWDQVSVWSLPSVERVSTLPFESRHSPVTALAFDSAGTTIFTAHPLGHGEDVRQWDVRSGKVLNVLNLRDDNCYFPLIELADNGRVLVTACKDIRRWSISTSSQASVPTAPTRAPESFVGKSQFPASIVSASRLPDVNWDLFRDDLDIFSADGRWRAFRRCPLDRDGDAAICLTFLGENKPGSSARAVALDAAEASLPRNFRANVVPIGFRTGGLLVGEPGSKVYFVGLDSGRSSMILDNAWDFGLSPDGSALAFEDSANGNVWLLDLESAKRKRLTNFGARECRFSEARDPVLTTFSKPIPPLA